MKPFCSSESPSKGCYVLVGKRAGKTLSKKAYPMVLRTVVLWALLLPCLFSGTAQQVLAAPSADLWPRWQAHQPNNPAQIDHAPWQRFLDQHLLTTHPSHIHRLQYTKAKSAQGVLKQYLQQLQQNPISTYRRAVQQAYWINLYNAFTAHLVLTHQPKRSIREISSGWFSGGPWDGKWLRVEGQSISLNDIEHRILRPIWQDPRLHYALNCASLGCPNLLPTAFTAQNSEEMLNTAARAYINHPRGVTLQMDGTDKAQWWLSSIYHWYREDFGSDKVFLAHLKRYANPPLAEQLNAWQPRWRHHYDWQLNAPQMLWKEAR